MPDGITIQRFVQETKDDVLSPNSSNFWSTMNICKNTINSLDESLELDRAALHKLKKSIKTLYQSGNAHVENEMQLAESLTKLGTVAISREAETGIGTAFLKFSVVAKELSALMKNLLANFSNTILFPLDTLLKGDLNKGQDLRKVFDKAWKEYEGKISKMEKEKKKDSAFIKPEVPNQEISDEMEKEKRTIQLQMCEYFMKVSEIKCKKGVELVQHLVEFYHAQITYFTEGMQVLEGIRSYVNELVSDLQQLKMTQDEERRDLSELRNRLKTSLQVDSIASNHGKGGYNLHGLQGDKIYGTERSGYLLKRSEGLRKMWQKRYCVIRNGHFTLAHSPTSSPTQTLNLLVCQVKDVRDKESKKYNFSLITPYNNRTYLFQAEDEGEMDVWVSVISNSREEALKREMEDGEQYASQRRSSVVHSVKELTQSIVLEIKKLPGNHICVDCNDRAPTWLSTNLGVLTCLNCSGIHREMGVHVSRIRSITLDVMVPAELLLARNVGNGFFNEVMEATLDYNMKLTPSSSMDERRAFIKAKYIDHKFIQRSGGSPEDLQQELAQAIKSKDILAVLQVFAEGVDLMSPLPDYEDGFTALHLAVEEEDLTTLHIVDFLGQNSKNQNTVTTAGNTPLHLACYLGKTECCKVLIRAGSNAKAENNDEQLPIDLATSAGHDEIVDLLTNAASGKMSKCDHIKIDWNLTEQGIYDEPLDLAELKLDIVSDDEQLDETPKHEFKNKTYQIITNSSSAEQTSRPPPPVRPYSVMVLPSTRPGVPLSHGTPGLGTLGSKNPPPPPLPERRLRGGPGDSSSLQRKGRKGPAPPPPPQIITDPLPMTLSLQSSTNHHTTTQASTFGHGPKTGGLSTTTKDDNYLDTPPPLPPVRGSSFSGPSSALKPPPLLPRPKDLTMSPQRNVPLIIPSASPAHRLSPDDAVTDNVQGEGHSDVQPPPRPDPDKNSKDPDQNMKKPEPPSPAPELPPRHHNAQTRPRRVQALYDCEADNEDELTFMEGEIIIVTGDADPEWWMGYIVDCPQRKGVFPISFVHVLGD